MSPEVVIFDWHGVLDKRTFSGLVRRLAETSQHSMDEVRKLIHPAEERWIIGHQSPNSFWEEVRRLLALSTEQIQSAKDYILTVEPTSLWDILPALERRFKLAILSDCPFDKFGIIQRQCNLEPFAVTHFSCERQMDKSRDEFFLAIAHKLGHAPEESLYVDDNPSHCEHAARLKFRTLQIEIPGQIDLGKFKTILPT